MDEAFLATLGDPDDDLSQVLSNVRVNRLPATREAWANSWQTREFLHLGLLILHEHQFRKNAAMKGEGLRLTSALTPEMLANKAQLTIEDPDRAAALSVVRWKETWGHQAAYTEDLIAYLFRPGPYRSRVERIRPFLAQVPADLTFGAFSRGSTEGVWRATVEDPLQGLQAWVQASMPYHPVVKEHTEILERESREAWAGLLGVILDNYGLVLKYDVTLRDLARLFRSQMAGTAMLADRQIAQPRTESGESLLSLGTMALVCTFCEVSLAELESRLPVPRADG